MSALHTLPSAAAVAATTKATAASLPVDPAASEVSFAAVLSAQLGLSSTAPLSIFAASSDEPVSEQKVLPPDAPDAPADTSGGAVGMVPLVLPVAVQTPVAARVEDIEHDATQSTKPAQIAKTLLPSVQALRSSFVPDQPSAEAPAIESSASVPANFAAALQALPAPGQDATQREHAVTVDDPPATALPVATVAVAPGPQSTHRAAPLAMAVPVPVQDARWSNAFSEKVVWITGQHVQAAEIHVEPPQLGPIEVRVSITNDQANLLFNAPHAVARDAIQMALPRLQEMLVESGLTLGNVSVGAHDAGGQQARDGADRGAHRSSSDAIAGVDSSGTQATLRIQRGLGLVDLFA